MQEDITMRSINISVSGTKMTGRMFARAVTALYRHLKNGHREPGVIHHGKQSVKALVGQNQGVTSIEIQDQSIKDFERVARKYGVDFAIKRVNGQNKFLIFFKGRDMDALQAAFGEYTDKQMNRAKKPSLRKTMERIKAQMVNRQRDPIKNKHQEQSL